MNESTHTLYIVATPIGNLEDITYRAIRILKEVDIILCEDTRVTRKLLQHYGIQTPTQSYHTHSTSTRADSILDSIAKGTVYALVSDAGTPTISDPGVKLIHDAYERFGTTIDVISIPGPTALITALSSTGFMGNQFQFYGFLPHKKGRKKIFDTIFHTPVISVFYESPHRLMKTLETLHVDYYHDYPERIICIARELTKMYEQKVIGTIQEVHQYFIDHPEKIKGECVVVINA